MYHTFAPSEMTKADAIAHVQKGTVVRNNAGEEAIVSVAPDPTKSSGRFGVDGNTKRTQQPGSWTIVKQPKTSGQYSLKQKIQGSPRITTAPKQQPTADLQQTSSLSSKHQNELDALLERQHNEMNQLKKQLQLQETKEIQKMEQKHLKEIEKLKTEQRQQATQQARSQLQLRHAEELQQMQETQHQEIENLKKKQKQDLQQFDDNAADQ